MKKLASVALNTRLSYLFGSVQVLVVIILTLGSGEFVRAANFMCSASNISCLISSMNTANGGPDEDTIFLEPGTYSLTTVDNVTEGPNGLPSVRTPINIRGSLTNHTIIEGDASAPLFRIFHVGSTGNLMLENVKV